MDYCLRPSKNDHNGVLELLQSWSTVFLCFSQVLPIFTQLFVCQVLVRMFRLIGKLSTSKGCLVAMTIVYVVFAMFNLIGGVSFVLNLVISRIGNRITATEVQLEDVNSEEIVINGLPSFTEIHETGNETLPRNVQLSEYTKRDLFV
ncbi:hypothetical protein L596_009805 [Steinernema carpocapsae]|uniref:Uncharacterized protein n=1 Tax=Steinernema carpocapsae TaxID=34508 RepID=A0A4U5PH88_STECR|nr:hypothetical protein L596_009805 [Steinernema carpocapsae]